jgi:hypothetical protein
MRAFFISCALAMIFVPPFASFILLGERSFSPRFPAGLLLPLFFAFIGALLGGWSTARILGARRDCRPFRAAGTAGSGGNGRAASPHGGIVPEEVGDSTLSPVNRTAPRT